MIVSLKKKFCAVGVPLLWGVAFVLVLLLAGCSEESSSGSGGGEAVPLVKEGIFIDSAVEGLNYETPSQRGITDSGGSFRYLEGEEVTFRFGDIVIGTSQGKRILTPIDLVEGAIDETDPVVTNICRFLQGLDRDGNPENGIRLTEAVRDELQGKPFDFTLPVLAFRNSSSTFWLYDHLVSEGLLDGRADGSVVPSIHQARRHLRSSLAKHGLVRAATPNGVYIGLDGVVDDDPTDGVDLMESRLSVDVPHGDVASLVAANSRFGFQFHKRLSTGGNFLFSPYALSTLLAMCYNGARNDSAEQIAAAAQFPPDPSHLNKAFNALDLSLNRPAFPGDARAVFMSRTAAWGQSEYPLAVDFFNSLSAHFGAPLSPLGFKQSTSDSWGEITEWVTGQSEKAVPELEASISDRTRFAFVSTNIFQGWWTVPVEEEEREFNISLNSASMVPMIRFMDTVKRATCDLYDAVEFFPGTRFGFLVVMPKFGHFGEVEKQLQEGGLSSIIPLDLARMTDLSLPEFVITSAGEFQTPLKHMGMVSVWDEDEADFTGIHPVDKLCVQGSAHGEGLIIDTTGVRVSSWNTISMQGLDDIPLLDLEAPDDSGFSDYVIISVPPFVDGGEKPEKFVVNRPFLFVVYERETNAVLYSGCIRDLD